MMTDTLSTSRSSLGRISAPGPIEKTRDRAPVFAPPLRPEDLNIEEKHRLAFDESPPTPP